MTATFDRLALIAGSLFDRKPIDLTPETHLADDLRADSFDAWELLLAVEDEFGFEIGEADVKGGLNTLADVVTLIERKTAGKVPA